MDNCLKWAGKTRKDGRGYAVLENKIIDSARYTYLTSIGKIPNGMCVSHFCKNKYCVNINHLKLRPKSLLLSERFYQHVHIPKNEIDCWEWCGKKDKDGYGTLYSKNIGNRAHRISYFLNYGEIPKKLCVCHTCDNRGCVNPKHLWLGTNKENNRDRDNKGRTFKSIPPVFYGKDNPKTKLTKNQVIEIRDLLSQGLSRYRLAKIYKVSEPNIRSIDLRITWKDV